MKCAVASAHANTGTFEIRLHAYASFHEKLLQLFGKCATKRAPEGALW
jgi:hypothetical protein